MTRTLFFIPVLIAVGLGALQGCSSPDGDENQSQDEGGAALEVDAFSFELDNQRLLSSLTDEEISEACDDLATTLHQAEELTACQIEAAGTTDNGSACSAAIESCMGDPSDALAQSELTATPAPIDCDDFNAALTADCDQPVAILEVCINSLAQSLAPSRNALSCDGAAEVNSVAAANDLAKVNKGSGYIGDCIHLLSCESLVSTLLNPGG